MPGLARWRRLAGGGAKASGGGAKVVRGKAARRARGRGGGRSSAGGGGSSPTLLTNALFSDPFTNADISDITGYNGWGRVYRNTAPQRNAWRITSNQAAAASTSNSVGLTTYENPAVGGAEGPAVARADITFRSASLGSSSVAGQLLAGPGVCMNGTPGGYFALYEVGGDRLRLHAAGVGDLATFAATLLDGDRYGVQRQEGGLIALILNDVIVASAVDTTYESGDVGLYLRTDSTNDTFVFDDFAVFT